MPWLANKCHIQGANPEKFDIISLNSIARESPRRTLTYHWLRKKTVGEVNLKEWKVNCKIFYLKK